MYQLVTVLLMVICSASLHSSRCRRGLFSSLLGHEEETLQEEAQQEEEAEAADPREDDDEEEQHLVRGDGSREQETQRQKEVSRFM